MDNDSIKVFQSNSTSSQKPNDAIKVWISNIDEIPGGGGGGANPTFVEGYGITFSAISEGVSSINVTSEIPADVTEVRGHKFIIWLPQGTEPPTINDVSFTRVSDLDNYEPILTTFDNGASSWSVPKLEYNEYGTIHEAYICEISNLKEKPDIYQTSQNGDGEYVVTTMDTGHDNLFENVFTMQNYGDIEQNGGVWILCVNNTEDLFYNQDFNGKYEYDYTNVNANGKIYKFYSDFSDVCGTPGWFKGCDALTRFMCNFFVGDQWGTPERRFGTNWAPQMFEGTNINAVSEWCGSQKFEDEYSMSNFCNNRVRMFYNCSGIEGQGNYYNETVIKALKDITPTAYVNSGNSFINWYADMYGGNFAENQGYRSEIPSGYGGTFTPTGTPIPSNCIFLNYYGNADFENCITAQPNVGSAGVFGQNNPWWDYSESTQKGWIVPITGTSISLASAWQNKIPMAYDDMTEQAPCFFEMDPITNQDPMVEGNAAFIHGAYVSFNVDNLFDGCGGVDAQSQYGQFTENDIYINSHVDTFKDTYNNGSVPTNWGGTYNPIPQPDDD